jgi:parallel beta-helix repeat protein
MSRVSVALLSLACALLICGMAGAVDYGTITVTSTNCAEWSTNLSNNVSTVTGGINVETDALLNLSNATIRMDGNSITVKSGATMNVTNGSNITRDDSGYYSFNYELGSYGRLNDSIVEYSNELKIQTINNITIDNCTIRNNWDYGIYLTSTSRYVNITDCMINNTVQNHGIFIESSQGNTLRSNSLNNNSGDYSLYVTGDYDQDIDTTNTVNGGKVYYNYADSDTTITDTNIGHVTIVNCSNLWFTDCTIHNGDGVRIIESSSNGMSGSTIKNNTGQGVYFADSSNNTINDSYILDNSEQGIYSTGSSSYNSIINNSIINNSAGIHLVGSGYNNITDNNVSENTGDGICIGSANYHPDDNIIRNNTIRSNSGTGVTFYSKNNRLSENNISDNTNLAFQLVGDRNDKYHNYIWRNNTANGKEVNYYYNEHDLLIESKHLSTYNVSNVGKITLIGCTNITVIASELSNNTNSGYGIFLWNSNNNNLTNNTISNNYNGILLHGSSSNNITDLDTASPSKNCGAHFELNSNYNNITDSSFAATGSHGMSIASEHITVTNTTISSASKDGVSISGSYTTLTNVTINSTNAKGLYTSGDYTTITESNITTYTMGVHCSTANHTDIINTTITAGTDGIYMSKSHWGNLTNNTIDATSMGIFLTTSGNHNLTSNNITNYTITGILLEEYSTNNTMIENDLTRNGAEFDIRINDSDDATIANNESTAANYIFYLTNNTRLCTLDTVFDKTKVGYEDTSNLMLMWRIDVLCWDNYHREDVWANLTVRYGDLSDIGNVKVWGEEEIPLSKHGRLSGNDFDYYGPPTSSSNWLPIVEYTQNVTGKTTYQPMNCTAINRWDKLQGKNIAYRNVTTAITGPGVTILVDTGYTPNGKCYYCHLDKLKFKYTEHWLNYTERVFTNLDEPYTPGRCIDCHDENDSIAIPHGNESGKDLLYQQSPQLCYTGRTDGLDCHSANATQTRLDQETEFSQTTHHPLGDGQLACKACHDNHGTEHDSDLLKYYKIGTSGGYNSADYALCLVCHLEEKIVAKMSGETGHLANYMNKTNFRDEYYLTWGFSSGGTGGNPKFKNIHSPQNEMGINFYDGVHPKYNCYSCHNPHGSDNPATTRFTAKSGGTFNYTYITNVSPPNNIAWEVLGHDDWNKSELNMGGGTYNSQCGCHDPFKLQTDYFTYRTYIDYEPAGGAGCLECHDSSRAGVIRPILNLSAVKIAMHTNLSWWAEEDVDADLPGTDLLGMSLHQRYTTISGIPPGSGTEPLQVPEVPRTRGWSAAAHAGAGCCGR